jgi:hypothetical protein
VRLLIDVDQLEGRPEQPAVLHALTSLITGPQLGHVSLLLTSRTVPALPGIDRSIPMPGLDADTAHRYLQGRHLDDGAARLVELATALQHRIHPSTSRSAEHGRRR